MARHMASSQLPFLHRPDVRAGLTSCVVMAVSDATCQALMSSNPEAPRVASSGSCASESAPRGSGWDPSRTARFAVLGLTLHGPFFYHGFRHLDRAMGPSRVPIQVTLFPLYLASLLLGLGLLEGRGPQGALGKLRDGFWGTFKNGCAFWPAANVLNFMLVPPSGRVFYVNGAGLLWNTYLSYANSRLQPKGDVGTEEKQ